MATKDVIGDLHDFGLGNLFLLKYVSIYVDCIGACRSDVEEVEAAVRRAVEGHPKNPTFHIKRSGEHLMLPDSSDEEVERAFQLILQGAEVDSKISDLFIAPTSADLFYYPSKFVRIPIFSTLKALLLTK
jgi:hypothetical protein